MKKVDVLEGQSLNVVNDNIGHLKALFPEAFTENGVDFNVLRQLLGDAKMLDKGEEKYGLNWHGKKKARQIALTPSLGTFLPCMEESVDWDNTGNIFIEGDNLEVLKLLQRSYANKVKMIYIDPPYNTGKEFVYPDNFQDNLDTYLRYTGQKGEDGLKFSSNSESSGRKHTNWLNMMYPRLKLAKNLLRHDGVIFISIDDNEQANLKAICDDIFGEENFVGQMPWKGKSGGADDNYLRTQHEYIVCYGKIKDNFKIGKQNKELLGFNKYDAITKRYYKTQLARKWGANSRKEDRPNLFYSIDAPDGTLVYPMLPNGDEGCWRWSKSTMEKEMQQGRVEFLKSYDSYIVYEKIFQPLEGENVTKNFSSWLDEIGATSGGSKELKSIMDDKIFDFPKPISLIQHLCNIANTSSDDIILDFFAGSGTTAHAVMQLNAEDGGNRRFIMVQLPEVCDEKSEAHKAGYKNIADIGKERIRRAAKKIATENPDYNGDLGFKVFKLSSSNLKAWNPDPENIEQSLIDHVDMVVEGRSEADLLYELLLKRGVDLCAPIEMQMIEGTNQVLYNIGYGAVVCCFGFSLGMNEVKPVSQAIIKLKETLEENANPHVFFRDSAFADDIAKTNMAEILKQNGINHVRSL